MKLNTGERQKHPRSEIHVANIHCHSPQACLGKGLDSTLNVGVTEVD